MGSRLAPLYFFNKRNLISTNSPKCTRQSELLLRKEVVISDITAIIIIDVRFTYLSLHNCYDSIFIESIALTPHSSATFIIIHT